jgi:hypothetical protein
MEDQYKIYRGDIASVKKNLLYLTDDNAVRAKIPAHLVESSNWDGYKNLDCEALITEFITAFEEHYGGYFDTHEVEPIKVNFDAAAGKGWRRSKIVKKGEFYACSEHEKWLEQYIRNAHRCNYRENFSAAPKEELTVQDDIADKKSRVFYVAGVLNDYYASSLCKDFNAALKRMPWNSAGEVWQYGGFLDLADDIVAEIKSDPAKVIEESDCSKFDLTCIKFFFRLCLAMRIYFARRHGDLEFAKRLEHLYHQALQKDLIWFDGEIIECLRGNPSGWKNTTEDNCIRHIFIRWFHFTYTMKQPKDYFWKHVFLRILSDDSLCVANETLLAEKDLNYSYTTWNTVYKGYVKPLTRDITATTYLGGTFTEKGGKIRYTISKAKAFWSACNRGKLTLSEFANKLFSIACLIADDEEIFREWLEFIEPYGIPIDVNKARFVAAGPRRIGMDFSHRSGFSSGNACTKREAPSSGLKRTYEDLCLKSTNKSSTSNLSKMTAGKNAQKKAAAKAEAKREVAKYVNASQVRTANPQLPKLMNKAIIKPPKSRVNWYLMELLDPTLWDEALAHGLRGIPDFYSHRNHVFVSRTVLDLDANNFDTDGRCNVIARPQPRNHVSVSNTSSTSGNQFGIASIRGIAGSLRQVDIDPSTPESERYIGSNTFINLAVMEIATSGIMTNTSNDTVKLNGVFFSETTPPSANFKNFTYRITAGGTNTVVLYVQFRPATAAGNIQLEVDTDVATRVQAQAINIGDTSSVITLTLNAADTSVGIIRFLNNSGGTLFLNHVGVTGTLNRPDHNSLMTGVNCQNYARVSEDFSAVRCVAGYLWVKYRGDLTKNGSIAGALIDSLSTPSADRITSYASIASLLHSYEGSATSGCYGIWCPMNPSDTNFHSIDDEYEAPYLSFGLDVNDVAAQNFRVEAFFVWEGLTQLQTYAPEPGSVDVMMMNDAFEKLSHFDKVMCNDSHLRTISRFLSGGYARAKGMLMSAFQDPATREGVMKGAELVANLGSMYPAASAAAKIFLNSLKNL